MGKFEFSKNLSLKISHFSVSPGHLKERIIPKYFSNIKNMSLLMICFSNRIKLYSKWVMQETAKSILIIVSTFQHFPGTIENQIQPLNFLFKIIQVF